MDTLEQFLKRHIRNEAENQRGIFCPPEIELAQYIDQTLDEEVRPFIAQHLDVCQQCKQEVALLEYEPGPLLQNATQGIRAFVEGLTQEHRTPPQEHALATIIAEFTSNVIHVIETTGQILGQSLSGPAWAVRGEHIQRHRTRIRHILEDIVLTLTLQPETDQSLHLEISVRNQNNGEPIPDSEIVLEKSGEQTSYKTDTLGQVLLESIPAGHYDIILNQKGHKNQRLALELNIPAS